MLLTPQHRRSNRRRSRVILSPPPYLTKKDEQNTKVDFVSCDICHKRDINPDCDPDGDAIYNLALCGGGYTHDRCMTPKMINEYNEAIKSDEKTDDECPHFPGYEYDREYYLASSRYSSFVDQEIESLKLSNKNKK